MRQPDCRKCNDLGCEVYYKRKNGASYVFQCDCKMGPYKYSAYPKCFDGMDKTFASHRDWMWGRYEKKFKKQE